MRVAIIIKDIENGKLAGGDGDALARQGPVEALLITIGRNRIGREADGLPQIGARDEAGRHLAANAKGLAIREARNAPRAG